MFNNANLDLANINAYIRFGENLKICSKHIKRKLNSGVNQGHNSGTNVRRMTPRSCQYKCI